MSATHCIGCGAPKSTATGLRCDSCDLIFLRQCRASRAERLRNKPRKAGAELLPSEPGVLRFRSRAVARQAKARGEIVQQPCACCGDPNAQMHHPDYEEARLIVWLCVKHHHAWHKIQRTILPILFAGWLELERALGDAERSGHDPTFRQDFDTPIDQAHILLIAAEWLEKHPLPDPQRVAS